MVNPAAMLAWLLIIGSVCAERSTATRMARSRVHGPSLKVPKDSNFYEVEEVWEPFIKEHGKELRKALSMQMQPLKIRELFAPREKWTEAASAGMHLAITNSLFDHLTTTSSPVLDLGSGTGALLALFAEFTTASSVQGIEYDAAVLDNSQSAMEILVDEDDRFEKVSITQGDALQFNVDGEFDNTYGVINVGVGMCGFPNIIWNAVAVGGALGVPLCEKPCEDPDIVDKFGKCDAKYHVFEKVAGAEPSEHEQAIAKPIKVVLVSGGGA